MGFDLKRGLTAVASGGNSEWGAGGNLFNPGSTTQNQVPLETPEQLQARQLLMKYATTGQVGGITAGENLNLPQGNYNMSGTEQQGMGALTGLLNAGTPNGYQASDKATADLMNTSPEGLGAMFAPYEAQAQRQQNLAMDAAKRNSSFAGNLYSTDTVRQLGDVAAKTAEGNQVTLAGLQNDALNRKLQAAGVAQSSAAGQEHVAQGRIASAMQYGQLQRNLDNQRVAAQTAETLRRRNEVLQQLTGATAVSGAPVQFGVPSVTIQNPNPYLDFLKVAAQFGGMARGMNSGQPQVPEAPAPVQGPF